MPLTTRAVGTVTAYSTVEVRAQVTGPLTAIHFTEGQEVAAGQLLFSLDPRPFEAALAQVQGVLEKDTVEANNAKLQLARNEGLVKRGLIPREQYDTAAASAAALGATVGADQAAVENTRLQLQYTSIRAPVSGRTGALNVHAGDLVRANDATALVVINKLSPIYVTFAVPGRLLPDIRRFQAAGPLRLEAKVPDTSQPPATGQLTFIDNTVDASTNTIKLKGVLRNRDRALWPGSFVDVTLYLTTEPLAVVVPTAAVQAGQQGQFVFVVKLDRTVEVRPVRVAREEGRESIVSGLRPGEEVVTDGQLRLTPGARVAIRRPATAERTPS